MDTKGKNVAIICYITLIGWIIAYIMYQDEKNQSSLSRFHLNQMLGFVLVGVIFSVANIVLGYIPVVGPIISAVIGIAMLIFWIMGLISAINAQEKPMPVIGDFIQEKINFIK